MSRVLIKPLIVASSCVLLAACASAHKPAAAQQKTTYSAAVAKPMTLAKQKPALPTYIPAMIVQPKVVKVKTKPTKHVTHKQHHTGKKLTGTTAVRYANHKAQRQPNSYGYSNSIMTYNFIPGALYQVYCAPFDVTDLQFGAGERITSIAAGDTLRWQVSKTYSGEGDNYHEHILIKPTAVNVTNSLVVTTDERTYHLQLHSTKSTFMSVVDWHYPQKTVSKQVSNIKTQSQMLDALNLKNLHFDYTVSLESGPRPGWMPLQVFDDGSKTYIQFPSGMQSAPLLYIGHSPNSDRIVNYRVEGNYYVVDSVIDKAQLRLGQRSISVVQISRKGAA